VRSDFSVVAEIVTPTEIAKRLGVTALAFRKWLREQKAEGHPLVASHEYRARYRFTRAEADQLAAKFAEQVRGAGGTGVAPKAPSTRTSRAGPRTEGATRADSQVEHPRST
jgi:phage antirepressor YoqD-like protein